MNTLGRTLDLVEAPASALVRAGAWRVECELGRGGMGVVYGVVHDHIGKRAALKVLRDASQAPRGLLEAQVVNRIGHPSVVDIFESGELPDGRPYLVMERVDGPSLRTLANEQVLSRETLLAILRSVARALQAAHAAGVVHRDMKPEHVILVGTLGREWRIKLIDWGIAAMDGRRQTTEGVVLGTPNYLSPEQAVGRSATTASDVYAVGVMAYELLLGQLPFQGALTKDVLELHLHAAPQPPRALWPQIPPSLAHLLVTMLAKVPSARPTMAEVVAQLDYIGSVEPATRVLSSPAPITDGMLVAVTPVPAPVTRRRRPRLAGPLGVLAAAIAGVGLVIALGAARESRPTAAAATVPAPSSEPVVMPPPPAPPVVEPVSERSLEPPPPVAPRRSERVVRAEEPAPVVEPAVVDAAPPPTVAPSSADVVARYTEIGRDLKTLHDATDGRATRDLWTTYRRIQIQQATATEDERRATTQILDELAVKLAQRR